MCDVEITIRSNSDEQLIMSVIKWQFSQWMHHFLDWTHWKQREYKLSSRFESRSRPPGHIIPAIRPKTNPLTHNRQRKKKLNVELKHKYRQKADYLPPPRKLLHIINRDSSLTSSSSSSSLSTLSSAPPITKTNVEKTKEQRITTWLTACVWAQRDTCVDRGGRPSHSEEETECTVYLNHWGDDIQGERWWQPLCLNGNPSFTVSLSLCCSRTLSQFMAAWFKEEEDTSY